MSFTLRFRTRKAEETDPAAYTFPGAELRHPDSHSHSRCDTPRLQGLVGWPVGPHGDRGPRAEGALLQRRRQRVSEYSVLAGVLETPHRTRRVPQ